MSSAPKLAFAVAVGDDFRKSKASTQAKSYEKRKFLDGQKKPRGAALRIPKARGNFNLLFTGGSL